MYLPEVTNEDCMVMMSRYPDKFFDLAVVDPPYGIGRDGGESGKNWKRYEEKEWDNKRPNDEYFTELKRVSKDQIIWGANYFVEYLPPSMGWIVWDKGQKLSMSDGELAYSSFDVALRIFTMNRCEIGTHGGFIHPTQKPVALYSWIFDRYAKQGMKILDTHLGSQSSRIAAHKAGLDFWGTELDKDYFEQGNARFRKYLGLDGMFSEEHF